MVSVSIPSELRSSVGTKAASIDRKNGSIPAVIYGGGQEPKHILVKLQDVKNIVYTPDFKIAEISVGGGTEKCILKSAQYHPVNNALTHIDFLRLSADHTVKVDVPVRFEGVSPGVKLGGKLIQQVRKVAIKTKPELLVDELKVDISGLELGGVVRVKNIQTPAGIEVMMNPSIPVANVEIPRALKSAATEEKKADTKK